MFVRVIVNVSILMLLCMSHTLLVLGYCHLFVVVCCMMFLVLEAHINMLSLDHVYDVPLFDDCRQLETKILHQ